VEKRRTEKHSGVGRGTFYGRVHDMRLTYIRGQGKRGGKRLAVTGVGLAESQRSRSGGRRPLLRIAREKIERLERRGRKKR